MSTTRKPPQTFPSGLQPIPKSAQSYTLFDVALHPALWRFLLFTNSPVRLAIAANVFVGRSLRSLVLFLYRKLTDLIGWLAGPLRMRSFRGFERAYFQLHRWHAVLALAAAIKAMSLVVSRVKDHASGRSARRRVLRRALAVCDDPHEWRRMTAELQSLSDSSLSPRAQVLYEAGLYDRRLLQERTHHLRRVRERGEPSELMFAIRADLIRNFGGMASTALHQRLLRVPAPIEAYIKEVCEGLKTISSGPGIPLEERLAFLRETRHAFGRTALVLSGGGSFGAFHLGVLKALLQHRLLPRVLSGSSAGAIVAALVCTRTEEELSNLFDTLSEQISQLEIDFYSSNSAAQILRHIVTTGVAQDHLVLQERLQRLLGDVTFAEAHTRSGRVLNVSVSAADTDEPPRLLNYLTAPDVLVWSAVAASSAFPFLFAPQDMVARDPQGRIVPYATQGGAGDAQRRWRDGSLEEDLPMRGLSEMFSVNYFLVSQANPYILPIISLKEALPRTLGTLAEAEFKHRCQQLMEMLPQRLGASRVLKLLSQPWNGDVTMVMPVNSLSALKAVVNLSRDDLLRAVREGQRYTWAKLPSIAANCEIEVTLDECLMEVTSAVRRVRERGRLQPRGALLTTTSSPGIGDGSTTPAGPGGMLAPMRRGIPSWMHLQSLGIPTAGSQEALGSLMEQQHGVAGKAALHRHSVESMRALGDDLTAIAVPEEDEEEFEEGDGVALKANEGIQVASLERDETSPSSRNKSVTGQGEEDISGGRRMGSMTYSPSLPCMDDVWLELFRLAPASSISTAGGGQALDFIAP